MRVYRVVERESTVLVLYKTSFIGAVNATVSFLQVVSAKLTIYIPQQLVVGRLYCIEVRVGLRLGPKFGAPAELRVTVVNRELALSDRGGISAPLCHKG